MILSNFAVTTKCCAQSFIVSEIFRLKSLIYVIIIYIKEHYADNLDFDICCQGHDLSDLQLVGSVLIINNKILKNDVPFLLYKTEISCFKIYFTIFHAKRLLPNKKVWKLSLLYTKQKISTLKIYFIDGNLRDK